MTTTVRIAKGLVIIALLVLLSTTYVLRARFLSLVGLYTAAQDIVAQFDMEQFRGSADQRAMEYDAGIKHHEAAFKKYEELLGLYLANFEEYQRQTMGEQPYAPMMPQRPQPPRPIEVQDRLAKINSQFRDERQAYFAQAPALNVAAGACACIVVVGLLFLLFFDSSGPRSIYLIVLGLSFAFLIGPAFHSWITAGVFRLEPPAYTDPRVHRGW